MSGTNPPSSASYANYVTAETVKYYDNASEVSSAKGSSSFMARSFNNSSLKRWILFLSLGFLLYLLFCIIYQATQGIYLSYDARNSRTLDSGTSEESVQAFINAHLPNRIGLWKQCSDSTGCIDLQLWCDRDEIGERLRSAGLLVKANADEEKEFIDQEAQLCPMYIASRTVSLLALFFGVMTVVGLWFAFKRNSNGSYLTAVFGAFFSGIIFLLTLNTLDSLLTIVFEQPFCLLSPLVCWSISRTFSTICPDLDPSTRLLAQTLRILLLTLSTRTTLDSG